MPVDPVQNPGFFLRSAKNEPQDIAAIVKLIYTLALHEKQPDKAKATPELIKTNVFDKGYARAVLAFAGTEEAPGEAIGLAFFHLDWKTRHAHALLLDLALLIGRQGLYLEDLFVDQSFRGKGVGKALFAWLAGVALEKDCARMSWQVLDWNKPAIGFYKSLGASLLPEWNNCRLEGDAISKLLHIS